jgi:hypothetical protein
MSDIRNLPDSALMDMLSEQTAKLTSLLVILFANNEYLECKQLVSALTEELEIRKNFKNNQTVTAEGYFSKDE